MSKVYPLLLLLISNPALFTHAGGQKDLLPLTIYYSSSLNGNLDGCECKSSPRAGLVKRAHYLRNAADREKSLLIDAGDVLDVYPDELLAGEIWEVYRELGYDAVAVGDQDFTNGAGKLLEYGKAYPLLSNNLAVCPDAQRCIFFSAQPLILEKASCKIGLFALLDPEVFILYSEELRNAVKLSPVKDTAENMLHILGQKEVDLKILLYHGTHENAVKLLKAVKTIDVAVIGHEQRLLDAERIGRTILVSPGEEGNRLGILELMLNENGIQDYSNSFLLFEYTKDPDDPAVRERIESYKKKLRSLAGKS